jgi:hypothetical protein
MLNLMVTVLAYLNVYTGVIKITYPLVYPQVDTSLATSNQSTYEMHLAIIIVHFATCLGLGL